MQFPDDAVFLDIPDHIFGLFVCVIYLLSTQRGDRIHRPVFFGAVSHFLNITSVGK